MSRVDELKQKVSDAEARFRALKDSKEAIKRRLRESKMPITLAWADIEAAKAELTSALKAESEKPMRFEVWLDDHGSPIWVSNDKGNCGLFSHEYKNKIIAIEKKPIAVTMEMGNKMLAAWEQTGNLEDTALRARQLAAIAMLKAIGIEALAGR